MVKLADAIITSQGQISIPKKVRDLLRLQKGSRIAFLMTGKDMFTSRRPKSLWNSPRMSGTVSLQKQKKSLSLAQEAGKRR